ncbi:capsid protein precursor [Hom-1 vesivirus]|uniref:capsid protein precursor n=1 Tax=Hom-1 vesivirus TaxID=1960046 RepID=UPI0009C23A2E|nr:capsid protein precursor [Hom-1 vesivirus]AQS27988.1 capsid protein precursor [Hom-1 vesivirus]
MATTHTLLSFDDLEFLLHKKDLTDLYGERCGTLNLVINPYDLFLPDELDDDWCNDPFNCCFTDVYASIGTEYSYIDPPELIYKEHCATNGSWPDGTPCTPILPPFNITGTHHYYATKPGEVVSGILSKLGASWDPSLRSTADVSNNFTFRAESDGPGSSEIVTEEQGVIVQQQPAPAPTALATLATASTGKSVEQEWMTFFSYHTSINWSTVESQGKVLYSQALNPAINPYLDHISKLYSTWSGGIDVRFTVSGSGVFGGKLAALLVPPGVEPIESVSMLQYPHVLFDARQTEPVIFTIPDIRKTLFHTMDDTDTTKLVIMVYNELINPYEGNNEAKTTCSITVETRPSADFSFALLKPPGSLIRHGSVPSDLIPRNSAHWLGNRWWSTISGFSVQPRVFQSNRHFDFNSTTTGWSTPYYVPIEIKLHAETKANNRWFHVIDTDKALVPGLPDGWPDTTIPESVTATNGDFAYATDFYNPATKTVDPTKNTTPFKGTYICGTLSTVTIPEVDNQNYAKKEAQKKSQTMYITTANIGDGNASPQHKISPQKLIVFFDGPESTMDINVTLCPLGFTLVDGQPIGSSSSKVVRIATLPEAITQGGNYPIFYVNKVKIGYFDRQTTECYNSQVLMTSQKLAEGNYNLPPDSLAVYRITDSSSQWFDIGINHDGFSFVGLSDLPSDLEFPLTSTFMGVQLARVKLASKVKSTARTI